jgi:hypothetical protein
MDLSEIFKSNFFKSSDIKKPKQLTISTAGVETVGDTEKLVLRFEQERLGLVCNRTNATALGESFGSKLDAWPGKKIELRAEKTSFGGRTVPCLRCYPLEAETEDDVAF